MSLRKNNVQSFSEPVSELNAVMDAIKEYLHGTGSGYKNVMDGDTYYCSLTNCKFFFEGNLPDNTKPTGLKDLEVLFTISFQYNYKGKSVIEK